MKINNDDIISLDISNEEFFSSKGCDNCDNGLGNNIYECKAYIDGFKDYYDINLCYDCIMSYHYGYSLSCDCKNKYNI